MTYYKVVLSGENIFFENYSDTPEPVIGFISCKFINADNEELAVATAKRDLLVHWNQSFNLDRKLGMPKLTVEHIAEIRGWFKPKSIHDYYWFTDNHHKQLQLEKFTQPPRKWFWRNEKKAHHPEINAVQLEEQHNNTINTDSDNSINDK
ncbi:hypothetical protein [Cellvibrio sp. pealriver]|uniref:hypothetical protein n=1 Tax=Cellvibrio sp. pealriver TaxID=1622269 RepID=UPI000A8003D1|nr:hypothetical protein [Cellvibrio sp. pealriver]